MRLWIASGLVALLSSGLGAQTPYGLTNVTTDAGAGGAAANNPWLGAQIAYNFGGTDSFSENFLVTARFLYDPLGSNKDDTGDQRGWHAPVMGNIGDIASHVAGGEDSEGAITEKAQALLSSAQGINVGLYPYYVLARSNVVRLTAHGAIGWKLNSLRDPDNGTVMFNEGRGSAGLELALGNLNEEGRLPITLSVAPVVTFFSAAKYEEVFGERRGSLWSAEITGILPVGSGMGVLFQSVLAGNTRSSFSSGLVFLSSPE